MADAIVTVAVTETWYDGQRQHVRGTLALDGGDYVTGGVPILLTNQMKIKAAAGRAPSWFVADGLSGYVFKVDPGTSLITGKLLIYEGAVGVLTELAVAAIPAAIQADTIRFYAIFKM